jgi:hypothetical protein
MHDVNDLMMISLLRLTLADVARFLAARISRDQFESFNRLAK